MFGKNIDFFAVFFIALAMLGFAEVRSWHLTDTMDSIHFKNAIEVEQCPVTRQVLSNIASLLR